MTQDTIRVGIIGAGANTRDRHIPGLQAIDGVEIVAVCNRSQESGERAAKQFGIERVCTNWQDIVHAPDVDAVVDRHMALHAPPRHRRRPGSRQTRDVRGPHGDERVRGPLYV